MSTSILVYVLPKQTLWVLQWMCSKHYQEDGQPSDKTGQYSNMEIDSLRV